MKTQKLNIRTLRKRNNNKESQFPSIIELSKSESDLEDCNMFFDDYDEHNATKRLISDMRCIEGWKFIMKQKEVMRVIDCSKKKKINFKCVELFFK